MEGLKGKKTIYLETLENLYQELTQACPITLGGRKFVLMGLLYDVHRVHRFFSQIESNLTRTPDVQNLLWYDADVDYKKWSEKLAIGREVKPIFPSAEKEDTPILAATLNGQIIKLRDTLLRIHHILNKYRMTLDEGKTLYNYEYSQFVHQHESKIIADFEEWKDQFDDNEELVKRNLKGKYTSEMLALFQSGFLNTRLYAQIETDKSDFEEEMKTLKFEKIPADIDIEIYYSALREIFDYKNQVVVPQHGLVGKFFFKHRKEIGEEQRTALFRFIKMTLLIQEEKNPKPQQEALNYEGIKIAMIRTYFPKCSKALNKDYNTAWLAGYMNTLMESELREKLARDWAIPNKRDTIVCLIIGALKEADVLKGSYSDLAKLLDKKNERTLAKYVGQAKKHALADWTKEYIEEQPKT